MTRSDRVLEYLREKPVGFEVTALELKKVMGCDASTGTYYNILQMLEKYGFVEKSYNTRKRGRVWTRAAFD